MHVCKTVLWDICSRFALEADIFWDRLCVFCFGRKTVHKFWQWNYFTNTPMRVERMIFITPSTLLVDPHEIWQNRIVLIGTNLLHWNRQLLTTTTNRIYTSPRSRTSWRMASGWESPSDRKGSVGRCWYAPTDTFPNRANRCTVKDCATFWPTT